MESLFSKGAILLFDILKMLLKINYGAADKDGELRMEETQNTKMTKSPYSFL